MSLASSVLAKGSSKLRTCRQPLDPAGTSQPRAPGRSMHFVAKYRTALVGLGAVAKEHVPAQILASDRRQLNSSDFKP